MQFIDNVMGLNSQPELRHMYAVNFLGLLYYYIHIHPTGLSARVKERSGIG